MSHKVYSHIMSAFNFYRPQRSWGKAIFSQASVILSTGGGGGGGLGRAWPRRHAWLGGVHGLGAACVAGGAWQGGHAWWGGMHDVHAPRQILLLWYTVNERVVCILLECILVSLVFAVLFLKMQTLSGNTVTCCHRLHLWPLIQTDTQMLRVNKASMKIECILYSDKKHVFLQGITNLS